jgi:uncharacterized membrane protein
MVRHLIELSAQGIEALAVAIIVVAIAHGTIRYLIHIHRQVGGAYEQYKVQLGKALLLGLEFLVAADIVRTVALEPTLHNVIILGLLVIVRTFLSWSLVVEIEGRWPWRAPAKTHRHGASEPAVERGRDRSPGSTGS